MSTPKKLHAIRMKTNHFYGVFSVFLVICLVVGAFSLQYYKKLHATIRAESQAYLQEVSRRIGSNLDQIIKDNFSMLETMAVSLEFAEANGIADVQTLLELQQAKWDYEKILLVDSAGIGYDIAGNGATFFTFDESMRRDLLSGKNAMTNTQIINNREFIIFAVPLNNVTIQGEPLIALATCYDPAILDDVLSMTSFDDQAYSQIVTKTGTVVTRSNSPYALRSGYNVFSTLQNAKLDDGSDLTRMRQEVSQDLENQISFSLDGMHRYMVYTPISPEDWYLLTFVPFQAVNERSDLLLRSTLIISGVIAATFLGLIAALYILSRANQRRLERIAYVDEITGGNTIQRFYQQARWLLESSKPHQYALVYTNIENFKVLNAQLGRKTCDGILHHFDTYASSVLAGDECMGRLSADNFCMLMRYTDEESLLQRLVAWEAGVDAYLQKNEITWSMPTTEFGIYVIDNLNLSFPEIIDRAKMALKESVRPVINKLRWAFYDDQIRRQLFRDKQLSDMMENALLTREFQLYLQPKVHLPEERIGGAEALTRWVSASEGTIYPDEFIPLFERNGFIVQLDLYIFEEVCRTMRSWLERGLPLMRVSVNCSRVHFKNPQFLSVYINLVQKYGIDPQYIEIELTESVVFENTEHLTQIIQEIRLAGFGCSMDDFGSGYSSLNLIQSIPVDTLKIDKIFFRNSAEEATRTEAVVHSIVRMAQSLSLTTVAEGVEYREQVEMLKRIGCDYIQGYVFARPMPVPAFETMAFGELLGETPQP